jgi:hypothetical protein
MHLIEVEYQDDAERRRIDYLVRKYGEAVEKSSGISIYVKDEAVLDNFLIELRSKVLPVMADGMGGEEQEEVERISVYQIKPAKLKIKTKSRTIDMDLLQRAYAVSDFMNYYTQKRGAKLVRTLGTYDRAYRILTRKGKVDMTVFIQRGDPTHLSINIVGYEPALSLVADELEEDLRFFKSQHQDPMEIRRV